MSLPGDLSKRQRLERILRVDQAGEFGARRIYQGQLAVLRGTASEAPVAEMAAQEDEHLATFDRLLTERQVRPTALTPLWRAAGFALGAGTALLGEKAAMACTVAVEEVIDEHYLDQIEALGDDEPELRETLTKYRADEQHHRDVALDHDAERAPGYRALRRAIRAGTKLAIRLSERV
ncbi:MAG: demethoxyubiquinone hydroxylase family protein [Alphaproteobacteria bacterium]